MLPAHGVHVKNTFSNTLSKIRGLLATAIKHFCCGYFPGIFDGTLFMPQCQVISYHHRHLEFLIRDLNLSPVKKSSAYRQGPGVADTAQKYKTTAF